MSRHVFLDAHPLSLACDARRRPAAEECRRWVEQLRSAGRIILVPEVADYEVRRELTRADKRRSLDFLDQFLQTVGYVPIRTEAMRVAARLWADARRSGRPTAADAELDGDAVLAAQAIDFQADDFVVATGNVAHLARFVPAMFWADIA